MNTCPCGMNLEPDDVCSVEGMCTGCAAEELIALRHKLTQIRTVVENYDDDWQQMSAHLAMAAISELKP